MTRRNKTVSAGFIIIIAIMLNIDLLIAKGLFVFFSYYIRCIVEGIIILMFARELRGNV